MEEIDGVSILILKTMIWVMKNGGKRRRVFKFIGFGAQELKSLERLDFKKLTLLLSLSLSLTFMGGLACCLWSGVSLQINK